MVVYLITNLINGKGYVGQTIKPLKQRWRKHCEANIRKHTKMPIAFAIAKYGKENFSIEVLASCTSQEEMNRLELHYATTLNTFVPHGYNLKAGNGTGALSEEVKQRIRAGNLGRQVTQETRKRLSESHKGIGWSETQRKKVSERMQGRPAHPAFAASRGSGTQKVYAVTTPNGETQTIKNLRRFCLEQSLCYTEMVTVASGKKKAYKGWTVQHA